MSDYHRRWQLERYHRHRRILIAELGGKCVQCGTSDDLQFDHIDPKSKTVEIGKSFNRSLNFLRAEAAKCQLLCRPCHEEKSRLEAQSRNQGSAPWNKGTVTHGTHYSRYVLKCSCDACIAYADERNRKRRQAPVVKR